MRRIAGLLIVAWLSTSLAGCCAGPYRFWQNYIGWNDPVPDAFNDNPPAPVTTPPGPSTPARLPRSVE